MIELILTSHTISKVEMNENSVKILLDITLEWLDPRIIFRHLKQGISYQVTVETLTKLWRPSVRIPQASYLDNLRLNKRSSLEEELVLISSSSAARTFLNSRESK